MYTVKYDVWSPGEVKCATLHDAMNTYYRLINSGKAKDVRVTVTEQRELTGDEIAAASKDRPRPVVDQPEATNES